MKALIIILLVLTVILLIPLGVDGGYRQDTLIIGLKIGPFNIKLFPDKNKGRRLFVPSKQKKKKAGKKEAADHTLDGIIEKLRSRSERKKFLDILKLGLESLARFRKKLSIDYLRIRVTIATDDPFKTAMSYAGASIIANSFFPLFDEAFNIKERDFGIFSDFVSDKTAVDVWLTATFNLLDMFYIGIMFGIDILKLKNKQKRAQRTNERKESNG